MIVGNNFSTNDVEHWSDLHLQMGLPRQRSYSKTIFHELRDDIMHGESSRDDGYYYNAFRYNREDGQSFQLFDSATGIKSFSILQMLLRNGVINKNTLLIDEPEAHLHPQWIVEYARIVIQMHKSIGTKFFIASHSTDFVSAIRYIAAKQKQLPSLNFYLGEESKEKKFMFEFRHLDKDIEPIFASFNKSYDKLSEYGV
jgi:predicted ATP-dependent endonuclease of OLD family